MAAIFYVDIPDKDTIKTDNEAWVNLDVFPTREDAVAYCLAHIVNVREQADVFISEGDDGGSQ